MKQHHYTLSINWTGNLGEGTKGYRSYSRNYQFEQDGKPILYGSSDPAFMGDANRYNPEELFLASVSSCHMLWFLHLCSDSGIIVTAYSDKPTAIMTETSGGGGKFESITLFPAVEVQHQNTIASLNELHKKANACCFIANSLNFKVGHHSTASYAQQ